MSNTANSPRISKNVTTNDPENPPRTSPRRNKAMKPTACPRQNPGPMLHLSEAPAGWRSFLGNPILTAPPVAWLRPTLLGLAILAGPSPGTAAETPPAAGITEAILDVTLSTPVPGIVAVRKFKEGDFIKEGEVLL